MGKLCCIFDYAPHYRLSIYKKMEDALDADFYFAQTLGTICRMSIFIILGSQVNLGMLAKYFVPSLIVVVVFMFIVRPICVILCVILVL